jgi:hypothetical protein
MTPDQPRFWPPNSGLQPEGPQPENLLQAAAAELSLVTQNEVVGELRTSVTGDHHLLHAFYLVAEAVGYRYLLFRATHQLGYPVTIFDRPTEKPGTDGDPFDSSRYGETRLECANAIELEEALRSMFQHPVTQQIVGQLQNLSRAAS